jgi:hypothetical protein
LGRENDGYEKLVGILVAQLGLRHRHFGGKSSEYGVISLAYGHRL